MLWVVVEIEIDPVALPQLIDDIERVYAEIFGELPGFVLGSLGVNRETGRAIGLWYFESVVRWREAQDVIEGTRAAVAAGTGGTRTLTEYEAAVHVPGPARGRALEPLVASSQSGGERADGETNRPPAG
ncbi:MAG TPA: hypothetical protein VMU90_04800 [Solirubrobacteraceae bacterium]|nr:hypothetical protein [Solirubrobacteraceae bacterium]